MNSDPSTLASLSSIDWTPEALAFFAGMDRTAHLSGPFPDRSAEHCAVAVRFADEVHPGNSNTDAVLWLRAIRNGFALAKSLDRQAAQAPRKMARAA